MKVMDINKLKDNFKMYIGKNNLDLKRVTSKTIDIIKDKVNNKDLDKYKHNDKNIESIIYSYSEDLIKKGIKIIDNNKNKTKKSKSNTKKKSTNNTKTNKKSKTEKIIINDFDGKNMIFKYKEHIIDDINNYKLYSITFENFKHDTELIVNSLLEVFKFLKLKEKLLYENTDKLERFIFVIKKENEKQVKDLLKFIHKNNSSEYLIDLSI